MLKLSQSVPVALLFVSAALLMTVPSAQAAQEFTMQVTQPFNPAAVEPSGSPVATISLSPLNGFSGSVSLACTVTPAQTANPPLCTPSPTPVTPPASPSLTVTTSRMTPSGNYTVTVVGTGPTTTQTVSAGFTILDVAASYTLTVTGTVTPTSVHAGSGATAIITITPVNSYSGSVTLSCSAVSPTATPAPFCSFNPNPVVVTGNIQTSALTINTVGPPPAAAVSPPKLFYALWLPLPAFVFLAARFGPAGKVRSRFLSLIVLCALATGLFFLPACSGYHSTSTSSSSGNTPNNTYTFTLGAIDANQVAPSNTAPTVSLTVN